SRFRLIRQLLTESLVLALIGGGLGLAMTTWSLGLIVKFSPADIPRLDGLSIDGRVLGFTLSAILTTGFIFGLAPALQVTKLDLHSWVKEGDRNSTVSGHHLRNLLIVSEIAVALVLLIGAGLLTNSFLRLMQVNPGFNPKNVLAMQIFISPSSDQKPGPFL